jgi:hypothetical protein
LEGAPTLNRPAAIPVDPSLREKALDLLPLYRESSENPAG